MLLPFIISFLLSKHYFRPGDVSSCSQILDQPDEILVAMLAEEPRLQI